MIAQLSGLWQTVTPSFFDEPTYCEAVSMMVFYIADAVFSQVIVDGMVNQRSIFRYFAYLRERYWTILAIFIRSLEKTCPLANYLLAVQDL
jgi:hypothetical protein